jgi:hypothetical protein
LPEKFHGKEGVDSGGSLLCPNWRTTGAHP